jgi:hypothetical protein
MVICVIFALSRWILMKSFPMSISLYKDFLILILIDLYIVHWQGTVYCTFWWCSISEHTIEFSSWLLWFLWLEEWLFVIKICSIDLACWYSRVQWNCFDQHTTQHCWAAFCKVTMEKLNITNVRLINWDKMSLNGNV